MVNYQDGHQLNDAAEARLDLAFSALADRTRRAILARLAEGEATAGELAQPFKMSLPAVSKHLRVLEDAGFLLRTREGRFHRCNLDPKPLQTAADWISTYKQFWEGQFDQLSRYLEDEANKDKQEDDDESDGSGRD